MVATVINVPAALDLSANRISVGDTAEFVIKFDATQAALEGFSSGLSVMASDFLALAGEVEDFRDQAQAIVGFSGVYSELTGLPDLTVYLPRTSGTVTDYREATSTDLTNAVLDFAAGNVAVRTLTGPIAFTLANIPTAGSAKLELLLTAGGYPADFTGIANLVWELGGQPPVLNTIDRIVFSKYDGDTNIYAAHSKVV